MSVTDYQRFVFEAYEVDGHCLRFRYALCHGSGSDIRFVESITLPESLPAPDVTDALTQRLLQGIHLALGVSYFKAAVPQHIDHPPLTVEEASFWQTLYGEGMGEFWYSNQLDPRGRVFFTATPEKTLAPLPLPKPERERVLVMVGGGKDSAVAAEIVKAAGVEAVAFSMGTSVWQQRSAAAMGLESLVVHRKIDAALFELNSQGAYNGHIPISACIAFVSALVAVLGGYSAMIVANERSANEGNTQWNGFDINHQWSKSLRFERAFQQWLLAQTQAAPQYFSVLRTMGELEIARHFARHSHYLQAFASCNANFRVAPGGEEAAHWCGHCPKCVFVQLVLKPFLDDKAMQQAFGVDDFISAPENREIVAGLLGHEAIKPFECVGAKDECIAAMAKLVSEERVSPSLQQWFQTHFADSLSNAEALWQEAMATGADHAMPSNWQERLDAFQRN
jgi:7-cyano-7-deazaguanine synthase in queuosine biosynthesis